MQAFHHMQEQQPEDIKAIYHVGTKTASSSGTPTTQHFHAEINLKGKKLSLSALVAKKCLVTRTQCNLSLSVHMVLAKKWSPKDRSTYLKDVMALPLSDVHADIRSHFF